VTLDSLCPDLNPGIKLMADHPMSDAFKTAYRFLRLRGSSSLFDRGYLVQFSPRRPGSSVLTAGIRVESNVRYRISTDSDPSKQSLDVLIPVESTNGSLAPVVVFVHGGGWRAGDKNDPLGIHANVCAALALRGLVVVSVNHRLSPAVQHPEHVRDVARALRWIYDNIGRFRGDAERIFISGHSSGAHLVSLLALDPGYLEDVELGPENVKGVIGISGIYNIEHFAARNWMALHLMTMPAFGRDKQRWNAASPVSRVRPEAPPFLLVNAERDEGLEQEAHELADLLRKADVSVKTAIIKNQDHFTILTAVRDGDQRLINQILAFVAGIAGL
jgi:arylformamidase